jgi:hypothetical protein
MKLLTTTLFAVLALLAGCSSLSNMATSFGGGSEALEVQLESRPGSQSLLRAGQPVRLLLPDVKDLRQSSNLRQIGRIRATVSDMHSTELLLDRDAAALLTGALRAQLTRDGFSLASAGQPHDFELVTVIRTFELNVAGRDELNLAVEASLRATGGSEVIWAGVISEKSDRFAGIMGNSRATITRYLGDGLANLVQKLGASVRGGLLQSYPQTLSTSSQPVPGAESANGVITLTPASIRDGVAAKAAIPAAVVPTASVPAKPLPAPVSAPVMVAPVPTVKAESRPVGAPGMLPGYGYISVISMPTRVKVYSDDIYYGLTPLKAMVPVGVMTLEFRFEGYKTSREKVSVRAGETTEIEFQLKK